MTALGGTLAPSHRGEVARQHSMTQQGSVAQQDGMAQQNSMTTHQSMAQRPKPDQQTQTGGFKAVNKMANGTNGYLITPPDEVLHSFSSAAPLDQPLYPDEHSQSSSSQAPLFSGHDIAPYLEPKISPPQPTARPFDFPKAPSAEPVSRKTLPQPQIYHNTFGVTSPKTAWDFRDICLTELKDLQAARAELEQSSVTSPSPQKSTVSHNRQASHSHSSPSVAGQKRKRETTKSREQKSASQGPQASQPKGAAFSTEGSDTKHRRAAPSKKIPDVHWSQLPDYSQPLDTLDGKTLHVSWKGARRDFSTAKDHDRLHPKELEMVEILALPPEKYLTCKRQILAEKLKFHREGKPFNRTAAQGACSIDVGKASQLHAAFNEVGWLNDEWFESISLLC